MTGRSIFSCTVHDTTVFLLGAWRQRSKLPNAGDLFFWHQIKSLTKQKFFLFVIMICFCQIIDLFSWIMNAFASEKHCLTSMAFWHQADWHATFLPSEGAQPDHVQVDSSGCCFPRELASFVHSGELHVVRFDPWHMTRSPPIWKCIWVGRYNNTT